MATYYGTYGQKVQYLASDPSDPQIGQVWYNSTSATLKVRAEATVAWASATSMGTARYQGGGAGTKSSYIVFNGAGNPPPTTGTTSEKYNGTTWTAGPALPVGKYRPVGVGIQTAALSISGVPITNGPTASSGTASFNGTSWTAITDLSTGRMTLAGAGTQTAALAFGGYTYAPGAGAAKQALTESWNGTSWTAGGNLPIAIGANMGLGTQTAAVSLGGQDPGNGYSNTSNKYNGSSWTSSGTLNTGRLQGNATGIQTAGLAFGGYTPALTSATELYNGTSWTSNPTGLNTARASMAAGSAGTQTSAICAGGDNPFGTTVEEWTGPGVAATKTVTVS